MWQPLIYVIVIMSFFLLSNTDAQQNNSDSDLITYKCKIIEKDNDMTKLGLSAVSEITGSIACSKLGC